MELSVIKNFKKNSYDFSATKEVLNEINNNDFKSGESDFYSIIDGHNTSGDTSKSYIWTAISAVADDVMESIYQNVLNYIDNVSNIDTCTVKSLQSMIHILGTNFSIFDNLSKCPVDLMNLVDIFSMRKDYLLNSEKVCQKMVDMLSSKTGEFGILDTNGGNSVLGKDDLSAISQSIDTNRLDSLISTTYYTVLSSHVFRRYNASIILNDTICDVLSDNIINKGFELPNSYENLIDNYKLKLNITTKFDQEKAADNIEQGLSVLEDYNDREQIILNLESLRRTSAKYKLEKCSRYSYYKERDVQDYFFFIEETYNNLSAVYIDSNKYEIDKNYIEINALSSSIPLMTSDGTIDFNMISCVAMRLLQITNQIREIREYLKSHAQRNYMKGTFLLIQYVVYEYLKNNIYPILPQLGYSKNINFNSDKNILELVEYIDQTQYNNIFTDIDEDKNDKSLNAEFWERSGSNGSAIGLDSTNIFKPADKLRVVTTSTFTPEEISAFYLGVLNNKTGLSRKNDIDSNLSLFDFLKTLFKVGADNSYKNDDGKVMCELPHDIQTSLTSEWYSSRRFTKDIDNYIQELSSAYRSCNYLLNDYEPLPNITYKEQLDEIKVNYDGKAYQAYTQSLQQKIEDLQSIIENYDEIIADIESFNVQFIDLTTSFLNLIVSETANTGNFQMASSVFARNLTQYRSFINSKSFATKTAVQQQVEEISKSYNSIISSVRTITNNRTLIDSIEYVSPIFNYYTLTAKFPLKTGKPITLEEYHRKTHHEILGNMNFEAIYNSVLADITALRTSMTLNLNMIQSKSQQAIVNYKTFSSYAELNSLSTCLSTFLNDQANIFDCVKDISSKLDYTQTDWYKYKEKLFNKYTGLSTSDIPFYYVENLKHPSYQIHPCLDNFIEYVDYSFPLKNLTNLAEKTITDISKTTTTLCIDNNGYLLSVWNNPLNGNSEYITRYEKSNHIDELGRINKYYGFDGLYYPDITTEDIDNIQNNIVDDDSQTIYFGLNLSLAERQKIKSVINVFSKTIKNIINGNLPAKILRYGIDIFGNSYILVNHKPNTWTYGILWFKPKNYPIAFPALVYDRNTKFCPNESQIDLTYQNSNTYFEKLYMVNIPSNTNANTTYKTPVFADFMISTDKDTILLNGFLSTDTVKKFENSHAVVANIIQEFQHDQEKQYFTRTFAKDKMLKTLEHFDRPNDLSTISYYYDGRHIGQLYAKVNGNNLTCAVQKYNQLNVNEQIESIPLISKVFENNHLLLPNGDVKFSCRSDGTFSLAYVQNSNISQNTTENTYKVQTYNGNDLSSYNSLSNTIDIFQKPIVTHDYVVRDELKTIECTHINTYAPYVDMGFIRLVRPTINAGSWQLSDTTFSDDFKAKKTLQFTFDKNWNELSTSDDSLADANQMHGIDFKYLCPIRVEELEYSEHNTVSALAVKDIWTTNISFQRSYGKGSLGSEQLSQYAITDVHVFDSMYNQYVLSGHIPEFLDLTEYERSIFDRSVQTEDDIFCKYTDLMKYDVTKYLSSQRDEFEDDDFVINYNNRFIDKMNLVTEPFLVSRTQFYKLLDSSYITAKTATRMSYSGTYELRLTNNIMIKIEVLKNDIDTIKLDFNPIYYFDAENQGIRQTDNVRNNLHLFLNLDKPGDSGYLNVFELNGDTTNPQKLKQNNGTTQYNLLATLFIKNISTIEPKFVLKAVYFDDDSQKTDHAKQVIEIDSDKETHMFRSSLESADGYILTDESIGDLPIEFS